MRIPSDYHDSFADIYDHMRAAYLDVTSDCDQFLQATLPGPGAHILDLGSGTGIHAAELIRLGYRVTGLEPAPAMLKFARDRLGSSGHLHGLPWQQVERVVLPGTVDVAASFANVLNCMPDRPAMLEAAQALTAVLRAGGRALIDIWNLDRLRQDGTHDTVRVLDGPFGPLVQTSSAILDQTANEDHEANLRVCYRIFKPATEDLFTQVVSDHQLCLLDEIGYRSLFADAGLRVLAILPQRPRSLGDGSGHALQAWVLERPETI